MEIKASRQLMVVSPPRHDVVPARPKDRGSTYVEGIGLIDPAGNSEVNPRLRGFRRFFEFENMATNCFIVAASLATHMEILGRTKVRAEPVEADEDGKVARFVDQMLKMDPRSSFSKIVRQACKYKWDGFSLMNWTIKPGTFEGRRVITIRDIQPRPAYSIRKFEHYSDGSLRRFTQRMPTTEEIIIKASDALYLVEDDKNFRPEGGGYYRSMFPQWELVEGYERDLARGYKTDMRNMPVFKGPWMWFEKNFIAGGMTEEEAKQEVYKLQEPGREHLRKQVRDEAKAFMMDSGLYESLTIEGGRVSTNPLFQLELLKGTSTAFAQMDLTIQRIYRNISRIAGTEQVFLGENSTGSWALSRTMNDQLGVKIDATMKYFLDGLREQIIEPVLLFNGIELEKMPMLVPGYPTDADPETQAKILAMLEQSMHVPGVNTIFSQIGIPDIPEEGYYQQKMDMETEQMKQQAQSRNFNKDTETQGSRRNQQ